jgi:hypothetical protein
LAARQSLEKGEKKYTIYLFPTFFSQGRRSRVFISSSHKEGRVGRGPRRSKPRRARGPESVKEAQAREYTRKKQASIKPPTSKERASSPEKALAAAVYFVDRRGGGGL